jgi:hypothetical protein
VIERRLRAASEGWFPPTPPLATAARTQLPALPDRSRRLPRRLLAVAFAALVLAGAAVAASVLDVVPGIHIGRAERLPEVGLTSPLYGHPTTLPAARLAAPFRLLLPEDLGAPDLVYLDRDPGGAPVVTAVYGGHRRARLVLTQWPARAVLFAKLLTYDARKDVVDVGGALGIWIEGPEHAVFYLGRQRREERVGGYLAGNVLVWQRGRVTYRLEAGVSQERALELAASLRPT